jgi:hypothetical protein
MLPDTCGQFNPRRQLVRSLVSKGIVAYGNIEGYNVHAYFHMNSISYTIPA